MAPPIQALVDNIERVIHGKRAEVESVVTALLAGGHVLVEDVPGVGKTMLARAVARSIDARFQRIQCTPDLLPTDVTGVSIYHPEDKRFEYRPGPIFTHVLLVDEINRATPRTQSAFLEAMEEGQVSAEGESHPLEEPFFLIATQNPIELAGTFPLPEAQLDRFLMRLHLGYPADAVEVALLREQRAAHPIESLTPVVGRTELVEARAAVRARFVHPSLMEYMQAIVKATREHEHAAYGASPRGTLSLMRAGQALAAIRGRDYVEPDDVKRLAGDVLGHRIVLKPGARIQGIDGRKVVAQAVDQTPVPIDYRPAASVDDRTAGG